MYRPYFGRCCWGTLHQASTPVIAEGQSVLPSFEVLGTWGRIIPSYDHRMVDWWPYKTHVCRCFQQPVIKRQASLSSILTFWWWHVIFLPKKEPWFSSKFPDSPPFHHDFPTILLGFDGASPPSWAKKKAGCCDPETSKISDFSVNHLQPIQKYPEMVKHFGFFW